MFRVLIADDHPLFRIALRHVIESLFTGNQVYEVSSLNEARAFVTSDVDNDLDMILLDLRMPGSEGFSGLITLRNTVPEVPIIVVSAETSTDIIRNAMTYGAAGFIPKSFSKEEMAEGISRVIGGDVFLPCDVLTVDAGGSDSARHLRERMAALSQGELRVFELLARGKANKIIAYELGIKESTVKAHMTAILRKLQVHSRTQAVIVARELNPH